MLYALTYIISVFVINELTTHNKLTYPLGQVACAGHVPKLNSLVPKFESVTGGGPQQGSGTAVSELHANRPSLLHSLAVISLCQVA